MLRLGLSYLEARPGQWGEGGGKGEESNRREARGVGREAGAQSEGPPAQPSSESETCAELNEILLSTQEKMHGNHSLNFEI